MDDFFAALGLLLVIEGLLYAAFPNEMREAVRAVLSFPEWALRRFGLLAAGLGLVLVWLVRG